MKPLIGILTRPELSTGKNEVMVIYNKVIESVLNSGGIPIGIMPTEMQSFFGKKINDTDLMNDTTFDEMKKIIDLCDGIICQGGDEFYDYDLKTINYCYQNDIPLLGICLGMQTMGSLFEGNLIEIGNNNHEKPHFVLLEKDAKLYKILGKEKIKVNSRHQYCLEKTSLDVVGQSEDGLLEAIEDKNKKFFIGVQWHPEAMDDEVMDKLFNEFIIICK